MHSNGMLLKKLVQLEIASILTVDWAKFKITCNKMLNFLGQNVPAIHLNLALFSLPRTRQLKKNLSNARVSPFFIPDG